MLLCIFRIGMNDFVPKCHVFENKNGDLCYHFTKIKQ
mgnify:CR=1 FL=1